MQLAGEIKIMNVYSGFRPAAMKTGVVVVAK